MDVQVTCAEAIENVARLLRMAEMETNLAVMERLERLADSWGALASLLCEREKAI